MGLAAATAALVYSLGLAVAPHGQGTAPLPERETARSDAAFVDDPADEPREEPGNYAFRPPSGQPPSLTCADARRVVQQVHATLAYAPHPVASGAIATATADWLDPHGLWSASPDSPVPAALAREGHRLLDELDGGTDSCAASGAVGVVLVRWTHELAARYDEAKTAGEAPARGGSLASRNAADEPMFDDEGRPARELASRLGDRVGRIAHRVGPALGPYVEAARSRFFPPLDSEGWAGVVRAAVVRAYVQIIDPHGAWAPLDEEASVYDVDLDPEPPERLWDDGVRTAIGVRVDGGPMDPLEVGDVVLSIAGVATAGLPLEQLDQLVYATTDTPAASTLVVLRHGELRTLELPPPAEPSGGGKEDGATLPSYRIPYETGEVLVVEIHDVRSDLGDALATTLRREAGRGGLRGGAPIGLLLDLRDDGGGSTEGAIAALSLFLPGAPLFPMAHRDGAIEVDRAPEPPLADRWTRPVATLVDGDTASAAEMIAGALQAYRRGAVVGERTYGKGCAQEYLDDAARAGVLRLTTLLYALPDGSPVQGVGLEPSLLLPGPGHADRGDAPHARAAREADEPNAPPTWRGPDVRDPTLVLPPGAAAWPEHKGAFGPCRDVGVCQALRALGAGSARRPTAALVPSPAGSAHR